MNSSISDPRNNKYTLLACILAANLVISILPISILLGGMFPIRSGFNYEFQSHGNIYLISSFRYYAWYIFAGISLVSLLVFYILFVKLYRKSMSYQNKLPNLKSIISDGIINTHNHVDAYIKSIEPKYYYIALLVPVQFSLVLIIPFLKLIIYKLLIH